MAEAGGAQNSLSFTDKFRLRGVLLMLQMYHLDILDCRIESLLDFLGSLLAKHADAGLHTLQQDPPKLAATGLLEPQYGIIR